MFGNIIGIKHNNAVDFESVMTDELQSNEVSYYCRRMCQRGVAAIPSFGKGGRQRDPPWIRTNYIRGREGSLEGVRWEC